MYEENEDLNDYPDEDILSAAGGSSSYEEFPKATKPNKKEKLAEDLRQ